MADNGTLGRIHTFTCPRPAPEYKHELRPWDGVHRDSPAQEYLKKARGGLDPVRGDSLHYQQSANTQDALIGEALGGGLGYALKLGGKLAGAAKGVVKPVPKPTPAPVKPVASGGGNGVVVQKVKPAPDGFKSYKTHGVEVQNPRDTPEGRRLAQEYERMGYSANEADAKALRLMETGSNLPQANPVEVGDRLYKVVPEGSTPGANSEFWATRDQINNMQGLSRDQIANRFGLPLESQQAPRFDVMEIQATRPGTAFVSDVAPTTQNGWSQTGGASQTLVPDRSGFTPPVRTGQKLP